MPDDAVPQFEPLRPSECEALGAALASGDGDPHAVHARLVAAIRGGRQWSTPEWKVMRAARIGTMCEQCGSLEAPFTLQHLWHPAPVPDLLHALRTEHREAAYAEFAAAHAGSAEFQDKLRPDGDLRQGCPRCGGWNLRTRSGKGRSAGKPRFACQTQRGSNVCGYEFDEPVTIQPLKVKSGRSLMRSAFTKEYDPIYQATSETLYRHAVQIAVGEFARYMSGEGTATFCKRCSYNWDKLGVRLCVECRAAWHPHSQRACNACRTGGTWVMCKRCGKARHLDRYEVCAACNRAEYDSLEREYDSLE